MTIERCCKCREGKGELDVVWECLPVPAFGDPSGRQVKAATIGLNPALNEWKSNGEWHNPGARLAIVSDYHKTRREDLTAEDCADARRRRECYFGDLQREWYTYFERLDSFLGRVNWLWSYGNGTVVHLDLVACATHQRFGKLNDGGRRVLLSNCREHFVRTLAMLQAETLLLLDGHWVFENLRELGFSFAFDGNAELIMINPKVLGWRGSVSFEGYRFAFRCWDLSIGKCHPRQRHDVAIWLRSSLGIRPTER